MTNPMKKHAFLLPFPRLFTRGSEDAFAAIHFKSSESFGDESAPALTAPATWSHTAIDVWAEAACDSIPADMRVIEENTVPSWLWRRKAQGTRHRAESDVRDIVNRIVGSTGAKAWKLGLFSSEKQARSFYEEARFALIQRHIAIAPDVMAAMGLDWAYGTEKEEKMNSGWNPPHAQTRNRNDGYFQISNAEIDGAIKTKKTPAVWKKIFNVKGKKSTEVSLRLSDIANDWYTVPPAPAQAAIDVMALRHNDGSVNTSALKEAVRLLVVILDMQERNDVTVTLANIAPLLLALGLSYDSDAGRALVASIAALVTAEGIVASAEMSMLRGAGKDFVATHETVLRALRNHRRAVYGDANDYEKLSVLPAPLPLKNCPDLALVAEAQRRWDEALDAARAFGLRRLAVTDMTPHAKLAVLAESATQGLSPLHGLTMLQQDETDMYHTVLHPAASEALARFDYAHSAIHSLSHHIVGTHSLHSAPAINHRSLRARGLSDTAIEKIETYIPCVNSLRLAITPWVVGVDFCRDILKIPAKKLQSPRFDLLAHLGFDDATVTVANAFCYGHGTARNAKILNIRHRAIFACGAEISTSARLKMAASVQSFISGDTGIVVSVAQSVDQGTQIVLAAWQRGLKSLNVVFDSTIEAPIARVASTRRIAATGHVAAKIFKTPVRISRDRNPNTGLAVKKSSGSRRSIHK